MTPSRPCSRIVRPRPVPRELDVALVGEHGDAVGPTPGRGCAEVVERAGRVARAVDPQARAPGRRRAASMASRSQPAALGQRHGHRPAPGEDRAHLVGRVGDRRVEDRVAVRACAAGATAAGCRRTPWCRCRRRWRAGRRRRRTGGASTGWPHRAARRCRCSADSRARRQMPTSAATTAGGGGSTGCRSTDRRPHPRCRPAERTRPSSRSYGYGGGTKPGAAVRHVSRIDHELGRAVRPTPRTSGPARATPPLLVRGRHHLALAVHGGEHVAALVRDGQLDDARSRSAADRRARAAARRSPRPSTALIATDPGCSATRRLARRAPRRPC